MHVFHFPEEDVHRGTYLYLVDELLHSEQVHTGEWQAIDTSKSAMHSTFEMEDVSLVWDRLPAELDTIVPAIDLEWAKEHFSERVSGEPLNPAPSHVRWPYAVRGNAMHTDHAEQFDHTYPERFWPKGANKKCPTPEECMGTCLGRHSDNSGIRFSYGDLDDVVNLLVQAPLTRQAYLPVWFPEDTGARGNRGEPIRVPCTLGYHFMQRGGRLSMRYYLRSCDAYRHLSNDIYLAAKLLDWVATQVTERSNGVLHFRNGGMTMHISSLHSFVGDRPKVVDRIKGISNG